MTRCLWLADGGAEWRRSLRRVCLPLFGFRFRPRTSRSAFTLVELLVVIGLIAGLAAILMPAIIGALKRADIARAHHEMGTIAAAIRAYHRDYGIMPAGQQTVGWGDHLFVGKEGSAANNPIQHTRVMNILRALDTVNNPRRTAYLEVPEGSMTGKDRRGDTYVPADGYYLDPWQNPYLIVMDLDGDNTIGGFDGVIAGLDGLAALGPHIRAISPNKDGCFPGVTVGVMSLGPVPGDTNSFMKSW